MTNGLEVGLLKEIKFINLVLTFDDWDWVCVPWKCLKLYERISIVLRHSGH